MQQLWSRLVLRLSRQRTDPTPQTPTARVAQPPALGGQSLELDPLDSLGLAGGGDFEPVETALCQALVQPGAHCLDVGANIGYYTLLFCQLAGDTGFVTAVEPNPNNYAILARNCAQQVQAGRVRLVKAALGQATANAKLYRSKDNTGMHRLYPSVCCTADWDAVDVETGDALHLAPLDFVKMDIEGYEPAALAGLDGTLRRSPQVRIIAEFSPLSMMEAGFQPTAFIRRMASLGLQPWGHTPQGWRALDIETLSQQVSAAEGIDMSALTAPLEHQSNVAVFDTAVQALAQVGYQRPLLESLLWVAAGADDRTRQQLHSAGLSAEA